MKKIFITILILFIILVILFLNLGRFLDATQKPSETELLVCLGGGDYKSRIAKTSEIFKKKLVSSSTIILTSYVNNQNEVKKGITEDKRITYLKKQNFDKVNIVLKKDLKNTAEEIIYIKKYMLKNNIQNVTLVSEPAHSRRILLYSYFLNIKGDEKLNFKVVGSYDKSWNKDIFYKNKYSLSYSISELAKIFYGLFLYGVIDKLGLVEEFQERYKEDIKKIKRIIHNNIQL